MHKSVMSFHSGSEKSSTQYQSLHFPSTSGATNRVLSILISLFLLILTLPFFLIIPLLIKLSGPGPIFYRGVRLGLHKHPYLMYKFRTLRPDAQQIIGASLVTERSKLVTPIGNFLRETRLDELPQLINVLKGDMNLIGPRPERPEIYEQICKNIPGYDLRFRVKPGVMGYAQLFTPHSSPKRLRSLIDRIYVTHSRTQLQEILLLIRAIWLLGRTGIILMWTIAAYTWKWIRGKAPLKERRDLRRISLKNAYVYLRSLEADSDPNLGQIQCRIIDINKESILIRSQIPLPSIDYHLRLESYPLLRRRIIPKRKIVFCKGKISFQRPMKHKNYLEYVIDIEPITPLNEFKYDKYFLMNTIS